MSSAVRHRPVKNRRENVLWIDDNIDEFPSQIANLAINRYQVFCCTNVGEFLEILKNYLIDVAIVDLKLSGVERGEDLVNHIRKNHKLTKIIIYSNSIPKEDNFKTDKEGNLLLAVDPLEQALLPGEQTRLEQAIEQLLRNQPTNETTNVSEGNSRPTLLDTSWQNLSKYSRYSIQRIMPALVILNLAITVSVHWDRDLFLIQRLLSNYQIIISIGLFAVVILLVSMRGPKEIRKQPSYATYMATKLVIYENDETFAAEVNGELEKLNYDFVSEKPFTRLSEFYQRSNVTTPLLRQIIFGTFWLAVGFMISGTVFNFIEFIGLVVQ